MAKKKSGPTPKTLNVERAESISAMGGTNDQIADALGVSSTTLKNIRKRDPAVDAAIQRGKDKADLQVVASLYKKALSGDTTACIFWLKNRRSQEWRDRHDSVISGTGADNELLIKVIHTQSSNGNGNGSGKEAACSCK